MCMNGFTKAAFFGLVIGVPAGLVCIILGFFLYNKFKKRNLLSQQGRSLQRQQKGQKKQKRQKRTKRE